MEPYIPEVFIPEVKNEEIEDDALPPAMFPDCTLGLQDEKEDELILDDMKEEDIKIEEEDLPPPDPLMILGQQGQSSEEDRRTNGENNTQNTQKTVVEPRSAKRPHDRTSNPGDMTCGSDNLEEDAVNKEFKNDHDQFIEELKNVPFTKAGDPALPDEDYLTIWPWFKIVHFLNDQIYESVSDVEATSSDQYDDQYNSIENLPVRQPAQSTCKNILPKTNYVNGNCIKKRRESRLLSDLIAIEKQNLEFLKKQVEDENDSERMFLLSLLSSMKTLNPRRAHLFRMRVQKLLYEAQFSEEFCSSPPDVGQDLSF